jgi:hypothetical protein
MLRRRDGATLLRGRHIAKIRERAMTDSLRALVERARDVKMSSAEREEQRRTFAYGNTHIENQYITREIVDEQAESLNLKKNS